jgi:spore germination protein GerM
MKTNKNTLIVIFCILMLTIGAVFVLAPRRLDPVRPVITDTTQHRGILVYFSKNKGSEIVTEPVKRQLPKPKPDSPKELMSYAITELLEGPTEEEQELGYFSEIPQGTKLLSVKEYKDKLDIDLSKDFESGGGSSSMVQRVHEIAKTVASVPQKKPVYLKVEGKQLDVLGGEGVMVHEPITDDPSVTN